MIRTPKAKKVLTKAEFDFFLSSQPRAVQQIPYGRLKQKVARARTLRDKYRALAKQQRREMRGKAAPKSSRAAQGNERTKLKEQIFVEVLARYQAALKAAPKPAAKKPKAAPGRKKKVAKKKAAKKPPAKKKAKKKAAKKKGSKKKAAKKRAKRKAPAKSKVGKSSRARAIAAKRAKVRRSGATKHQGHVSSRGRRNQAKRDSRGRR